MDKEQHMRALISEFRESGLSQRIFCKQRGINLHTFVYWVGKLKQADSVSGFIAVQSSVSNPKVGFETKLAPICNRGGYGLAFATRYIESNSFGWRQKCFTMTPSLIAVRLSSKKALQTLNMPPWAGCPIANRGEHRDNTPLRSSKEDINYFLMASSKYFIKNQNEIYFLTMTVIDWVDVFTRKEHKLRMTDALRYCQKNKGLAIHGWCLMSNHLHLLASAKNDTQLSDTLRDLKKFTSKQIVLAIQTEMESRRDWMLYRFEYAGKFRTNIKDYKFWQDGNHAEECFNYDFATQKLNYIHQNPVRAMIVEEAEHYLFSSARDYAGSKGLLEIEFI